MFFILDEIIELKKSCNGLVMAHSDFGKVVQNCPCKEGLPCSRTKQKLSSKYGQLKQEKCWIDR